MRADCSSPENDHSLMFIQRSKFVYTLRNRKKLQWRRPEEGLWNQLDWKSSYSHSEVGEHVICMCTAASVLADTASFIMHPQTERGKQETPLPHLGKTELDPNKNSNILKNYFSKEGILREVYNLFPFLSFPPDALKKNVQVHHQNMLIILLTPSKFMALLLSAQCFYFIKKNLIIFFIFSESL